jgi:hypothetical protein
VHAPSVLETLDPDITTRLLSRRDALRTGAAAGSSFLGGLALASVPVAIAALARDAFGQGSALPSGIVSVLNFALTLEYLESSFYTQGLASAGLIPTTDLAIFQQIAKHEAAHVALLQQTLGSAAVATPTFDFSGGSGSGTGPFGNPFAPANYATFQALSQAFEDTGVRAYKGQAPNLQSSGAILTVALQIHSVEARHAAEVRRLRGNFSEAAPNKGWITLAETDISGTAAVYGPGNPASTYPSEANTVQGGIDITTLGFSAASASEAFDEPLDMGTVLTIAGQFIA